MGEKRKRILTIGLLTFLLCTILIAFPIAIQIHRLFSSKSLVLTGNRELDEFCEIGIGTEEDPYVIENLDITDMTSQFTFGINILSTDKHLIIRNCFGEVVWGAGITLNECKNIVVENNTFIHPPDYPYRLEVGIHLINCSNIIVSNNYLFNFTNGIYDLHTQDSIYINNTFHFCHLGYESSETRNNTFSGNVCVFSSYIMKGDFCTVTNNIYSFSEYRIIISGRSCIISNNTCINSGGISIESNQNTTVSQNYCSNCTTDFGIKLWNSDYNTISNNTCTYNLYGIYLYSSDHNIVSNNNCSNVIENAVFEEDSSNNTITGTIV